MKPTKFFKKQGKYLIIGIFSIFLIIASYFISSYQITTNKNRQLDALVNQKPTNGKELTFKNEKGQAWHISNPGRNEFVTGGKTINEPKIVKAVIDPLKVSVGQNQTMSIEVNSDKDMDKVVAEITTDHKVVKVELKQTSQRDLTYDDVKSSPFLVKDDGELVLASDQSANNFVYDNLTNKFFDRAKAASTRHYTFEGSWMVHDTGETTYRTKFIAYDKAGQSSNATLAWSDPCSTPPSKNVAWASTDTGGLQGTMFGYFKRTNGTINDFVFDSLPSHAASCDSSALMGVEDINYIIPSGANVTLSSDKLILTPGKHITIETGGTIWLPSGNQKIVKGYLWMHDGDGDGYFSSSATARDLTYTSANSAPASSTGGSGNGSDAFNNLFDNFKNKFISYIKFQPARADVICTAQPSPKWVKLGAITDATNPFASSPKIDCDDGNMAAHTDSPYFCDIKTANNDYDWNCDGVETKKSTQITYYEGQYAQIGYWTPIKCNWHSDQPTPHCKPSADDIANQYAPNGYINNTVPGCGQTGTWREFWHPALGGTAGYCGGFSSEGTCHSVYKDNTESTITQTCN